MVPFEINKLSTKQHFLILCTCLCMFPLFIGTVPLFDWDEINFAEIAREMLLTKNFIAIQLNFKPFWEKPPLFFWIQAASQTLFGVNEFASRLPNSIVGIISIAYIYQIGKKNISTTFGFLWALTYIGTFLPHFYFKTGIIDPLFNLLIFASLLQFYKYIQYTKISNILFAATLLGLAFLTKGPVAILIVCICIFFLYIYKKFHLKIILSHIFIASCLLFVIILTWVLPEMLKGGGSQLFKDFIAYQIRLFTTSEAGHGQPFYYHFIVLFFGCFPISLIALPYLLKTKSATIHKPIEGDFYTLHVILFWVVLILFSLTTTKIIHYSSLCYFPLSFIAAYHIHKAIIMQQNITKSSWILLCVLGILFSIVFTIFPMLIFYKQKLATIINDKFVVGNLLFPVSWTGYEASIGIIYGIIIIYILNRLKTNINYIVHLCLLNALMLNIILISLVPKLERHIQGAYIDFLKNHKHQNIVAYGFKSYAQFFYSNKQAPHLNEKNNENYLLNGAIDEPVFIIAKIFDKENVLQNVPNASYLYESGGFVFFERKILNISHKILQIK